MRHSIILLGSVNAPTDGVADYCTQLGAALRTRGQRVDLVQVPWERGWLRTLAYLFAESKQWCGRWVLTQYTALSWSRRGFPLVFIIVVALLRVRSCRVAVTFHDPFPFRGMRLIDRARRRVQRNVMRLAYLLSDRTFHNVALENVDWVPRRANKARYVPVGANIPPALGMQDACSRGAADAKNRTVAVFGVTGGDPGRREVSDIAAAVARAAEVLSLVSLVVVGCCSAEAEGGLRCALNGANVDLSVLGVLPAGDVSRVLAQADVLLFVRGALSTQRSTAIAAIACGTPIVGYAGRETGTSLTEAGVVLVPAWDAEALGARLIDVLSDATLRQRLRERTIEAYQRYFSWDVIADQYLEALGS